MVKDLLTAMRQPTYEIGGQAVCWLLARMQNSTLTVETRVLKPGLFPRGSTCAPAH